jgi:hypothetical protein
MPSTINVSAELSVDDFAAWGLHVHLANRERGRKRSYAIGAVVFAVIVFLPVSTFWLNDMPHADFLTMLKRYFAEHTLESGLPLLAAATAYFYLLRGKMFRSLIYRQFRSLAQLVGGADETQLYEYRLDSEGICVRMPNGSLNLEWPAFRNFAETAEHFFVAYPWCSAVSIPKRALSVEQLNAVRALLTEKLGKSS